LARATWEVVMCQQERDLLEKEHVVALSDFSALEASPPSKTASVRHRNAVTAFFRTAPVARKKQDRCTVQQRTLSELVARAKSAKLVYSRCLKELDNINTAVHRERERFWGSRMDREVKDTVFISDPLPREMASRYWDCPGRGECYSTTAAAKLSAAARAAGKAASQPLEVSPEPILPLDSNSCSFVDQDADSPFA